MGFQAGIYYTLDPGGVVTPPDQGSGDLILTIKAKVSAVTVPSISTADQKYNKPIAFFMGFDDALYYHYWHAFKVFNGGTSSLSGLTYPGLKYSDGTGKMIAAHGTLVLPAGGITETASNSTASLNFDQIREMVAAGWSINNHSWKHGGGDTYYNRLNDIKQAESIFYNRLNYRTLVGTTPASEPGFAYSWGNEGYFCHNSTYNEEGTLPTIYGKATLPGMPATYFSLDRAYHGDNFSDEEKQEMKTYIDEGWIDYVNNGQKLIYNMFTHGPGDWQNFDEVFNYLLYNPHVANSQDKIWISGVQEWFEYRHVKTVSDISHTIAGDEITITIDQRAVMNNVRDRSMSLLCSGFKIDSIISASGGQDITFNPGTGLINLYNIDTTHFTDPALDVLPAQIIGVAASGNDVLITFDKDLTQTLTAGYTINGLAATGISGAGKNWRISFSGPVANSFLTYKSHNGDAVTLETGKKVDDYINYPVS